MAVQKLVAAEGKRLVSDIDHVALTRLVTEAAWRVDEGRADTLYELFVPDGELTLDGGTLKGRDTIREWGEQLEQARTYWCIRHVAGNMRFVAVDDNTAEGVTILTVFLDDEHHSATPWVVGEDHDRFVRTSEGWRFAARYWHQLFSRLDG